MVPGYKAFRLGSDLTINLHFFDKNTEQPTDISEYTREVFFTTGRGRSVIPSTTLNADGNTITWYFDASEQLITGDYIVTVVLYKEGATKKLTQDFRAFRLSNCGDGVAATVDLFAYLDFGSSAVYFPTISATTGNWVVGGLDTGFKAVPQDGEQGEDGKSAYQIAVEYGYEGTEEQWLASLRGDPGTSNAPITVVTSLPVASENTMNKIYFVQIGETDEYERWITQTDGVNYAWVQIGTTEITLEDYIRKDSIVYLTEAEWEALDEPDITKEYRIYEEE